MTRMTISMGIIIYIIFKWLLARQDQVRIAGKWE